MAEEKKPAAPERKDSTAMTVQVDGDPGPSRTF